MSGVSIDGNSIIIDNATIEIINGFNDETGVAYIIITPEGGVGQIPFLLQGLPGQPTLFPTITFVQHPAGEALPTTNPVSVLLDAGGSGLPAKYALEFHMNQGPTGDTGSPSIAGASDRATTPVLGVDTDKFILVYRFSDGKWVPSAQKVGDQFVATAISSTAFNNTSPRLLATISVPAMGFDWRPRVFAQTVVTGTIDTRVDLVARLDNQASGDQVGFGKGLIGSNAAGIPTTLVPAPPPGSAVPGTYGRVLAGNTANIYLRAEQKAASANAWSTPAGPDTTFVVEVQPIP